MGEGARSCTRGGAGSDDHQYGDGCPQQVEDAGAHGKAGGGATTHRIAADLLAAACPALQVDPDVLYVDNGQILTSAGAAAGLDPCLYMIRRDYGSAVAADAARPSVMPLEREGGQAQFIIHDYPPTPPRARPSNRC